MKNLYKFVFAGLLTLALSACGSNDSEPSVETYSEHDGSYLLALYNTSGNCLQDGTTLIINIRNGVIFDSSFLNSPVSGIVTENRIEAFIETKGGSIDIVGEFSSILSGSWVETSTDCSGYFEEMRRKPL